MSELKVASCFEFEKVLRGKSNKLFYPKSEVDAVIAELKRENERLVKCCKEYDSRQRIDERIKFNGAQQLRATKRALWLARADRADDRARIFYFNDLETKLDIDGFSFDRKKKKGCKKLTARHWRIIWLEVESKCLAKAEEYK